MEERSAVTQVPMLEPMMIGIQIWMASVPVVPEKTPEMASA